MRRESKCVTNNNNNNNKNPAKHKIRQQEEQKSYIQKTMNEMAIVSLFLSVITLYVID